MRPVSRTAWSAGALRKLPAGARVLDIGFVGDPAGPMGNARLHRTLREIFPRLKFFGLDANKADVGALTPLPHIVVGSIYQPPFPIGFFHCVLLLETLEHLWSPLQGLREAIRLLQLGGRLVITTPNPLEWRRIIKYWILSRTSALTREDYHRRAMGDEDHLVFFDPISLMRALRKFGCETLAVTTIKHSLPFIHRPIGFFDHVWPMNRLGTVLMIEARKIDG